MSHDKQKLEYEVKTTLATCVEQLEELVLGLKSGRLVLENRTEALQLHPATVVSLRVKARQKGAKESIDIELDWKREPRVNVGGAEYLEIRGEDASADSA